MHALYTALYIGISASKIAKPAMISLHHRKSPCNYPEQGHATSRPRSSTRILRKPVWFQDGMGLTWYLLPGSYKKNARNISCITSTSIYTMGCTVYSTFVYFTNAFETVSHKGLWKMMSKFRYPNRFILAYMA